MKRLFRRILLFFLVSAILLVLLVVFFLNPQVLYAREQQHKNVTFYSQHGCPPAFYEVVEKAMELVKPSELYDSTFHYDLFLNDGSAFPSVLKKVLGDAFAWGYHNNVVLNGRNDSALRFIKLTGYQRQLARTIAHEMIHCLQAKRFGIFGSRPLKDIPHWKWEGYPEYVAYRAPGHNEDSILLNNLVLLDSLKNKSSYPLEVITSDGKSSSSLDYFRWWLMVKYCIGIKRMSFSEIIKDDVQYDTVYAGMMSWFNENHQPLSPPAGP